MGSSRNLRFDEEIPQAEAPETMAALLERGRLRSPRQWQSFGRAQTKSTAFHFARPDCGHRGRW